MTRLTPLFIGLCFVLLFTLSGQADSTIALEALIFQAPGTALIWAANGNLAGKELTWDEAQQFVAALNQQAYAGAVNWRLPSRGEMADLFTQLSSSSPAKGPVNVQSDFYWSATVTPLEPDYALAVKPEDGSVDNQGKEELNFLWPVH